MSTPPSPWAATASRLWSAKCDKLCPAPRSDDYNDWSLTQLKREITQRQLKTNPRGRSKDAFVRVLLEDDASSNSQNQPPTVAEQSVLTPTNKPQLESSFIPEILTTQSPTATMNRTPTGNQNTAVFASELETSYRPAPKKQRTIPTIEFGEEVNNSTPETNEQSAQYLSRKLSLEAARLETDRLRLDLETNREQRSSELHVVQLALAQEQLQQAKLTTQKMKTEWMVEQLLQKKRLRDAGISQEESANIGLF